MIKEKAAARRRDKGAGAAFGLIIGIIIGSALLNLAEPSSGRSVLAALSAKVHALTGEFPPSGTPAGR